MCSLNLVDEGVHVRGVFVVDDVHDELVQHLIVFACHIITHTMSHHHTYYVTSSYILCHGSLSWTTFMMSSASTKYQRTHSIISENTFYHIREHILSYQRTHSIISENTFYYISTELSSAMSCWNLQNTFYHIREHILSHQRTHSIISAPS